jgi:predicted HTH domain antitoxin
MVLTLPDDIPALRQMDECELKRELAVSLYAARKVTLVQAADLACAGLLDFQALLRDRGVPQHYDEADLERDLLALQKNLSEPTPIDIPPPPGAEVRLTGKYPDQSLAQLGFGHVVAALQGEQQAALEVGAHR